MIDSEIIKGLKKWLKEMHNAYKIHLESEGRKDTDYEEYIDLMTNTIDLINRQKAEIERYKGVIKILEYNVRKAKSEAIKEFAEKLLSFYKDFDEKNEIIYFDNLSKSIYDTVKEMVGDSDE